MTLGKTFRYQGEKNIDFILGLTVRERPDVMVLSSVYDISARDQERLSEVCGRLVLLDGRHRENLRARRIPDWLTPDRAASVVAARYLFKGRGSVIFDFGTTLTIDCIDAQGCYLGGNVSPGFRTRLKALNRYSKALPLVDMPSEDKFRGDSEKSSIESGVISGIIFEIDGYIRSNPENIVIFTGGDAIYFAKRMKNSIFVVCNLGLMGLAIITDEYVKKNIQ
jgi:type III pantothenate kinase